MRIDPKFFNQFMIIVAVICLIAIAVTTFRYLGKQEARFLDRLEEKSLADFTFRQHQGDTLSVQPERTTVLLFWSTWSNRSIDSLYNLYAWHDEYPWFDVITAYVKDAPDFALEHNRPQKNRFKMLDGTPAYQNLQIPGIPTAIIFDAKGEVHAVEIGWRDVPIWQAMTSQLQPGAEL